MRPQPATVEDGMPADCMVRPRGFTLVEVIVAFVIAALALAAVYAAFSLGFAASEKAEDALRRQMVAENRLAELGILYPLKPGRYQGREAGITWEVVVRPASGFSPRLDEALGVQPMDVQVSVSDGRGSLVLLTRRLAQRTVAPEGR